MGRDSRQDAAKSMGTDKKNSTKERVNGSVKGSKKDLVKESISGNRKKHVNDGMQENRNESTSNKGIENAKGSKKGSMKENGYQAKEKSDMGENTEYDAALKEKITHMADQLEPDAAVKEQIWEELKQTKKKRTLSLARIASIAVGLLLVLTCGAFTVNATTGGALFESIRQFYGRSEQQVVRVQTIQLPLEVYAPDLVACSEEYVIFANERGMVVYDNQLKTIAETLDLQALELNYLNADSVETCIFMQGEALYLFNQKKESKYGESFHKDNQIEIREEAYIYYPARAGQEDALYVTKDVVELKKIRKAWAEYSKTERLDTFDEMQDKVLDLNELSGRGEASYSKNCIAWQDESGQKKESFLVVTADDRRYWLYTRRMADDTLDKQELLVLAQDAAESMSGTDGDAGAGELNGADADDDAQQDTLAGLPPFAYTGDDAIMRALCEEALKEADYYYRSEGSVSIPAPYIYETVKEGDDVLVFGSLTIASYYRNGNTLNSESGGSGADRIRLTPDGNGGYRVAERLTAGDGSGYIEDIESFCEGYAVSPDIYFNAEAKNGDAQMEMIKMYVTDNDLDIRYVKDYGWDPVEIK